MGQSNIYLSQPNHPQVNTVRPQSQFANRIQKRIYKTVHYIRPRDAN